MKTNVNSSRLVPPIKWWGGKSYLSTKFIALMPRHLHYVEPYFGGGAVLLDKDPFDKSKYWGSKGYEQGVSEVVNDICLELTNFWRVLQSKESFRAFRRIVEAVPFSQVEWEAADKRQYPSSDLDVEAAVAFFVRCRQSRAGEFKGFATLSRNRTRRTQNEQTSAWWNGVEGLAAVHSRLKRVVILNEEAVKVIQAQDGERTLHYLDPPYLHLTRASTGNYKHEMTEKDHYRLLETIKCCQGKVMLSGYPSELYDRQLKDWNRHDFSIDNKAAGGTTKRKMTESLWMNY